MAGLEDQSNAASRPAERDDPARSEGTEVTLRPRRRGRPVLRFVVIYTVLMVGFATAFYVDFSRGSAFEAYLAANARVSTRILQILDYPVRNKGTVISGKGASLDIKVGCDGVLPAGFFAFGVLAFPVRFRTKVPAVLIGLAGLFALNIVRILTLYLTKYYYPPAFHFMHLDFWQAVFVIGPMIAWVAWAWWARTRTLQSA